MTDSKPTVRIIRVFVSSPGDVQNEREVLSSVVEGINTTDGQYRGFRLELFRWEKNTAPLVGPKPQPAVDAQTPPYDIYLGIMSVRFGTPTDTSRTAARKRSSTRRLTKWQALGVSPRIMFYFNAMLRIRN
jgi:hypothetical protein